MAEWWKDYKAHYPSYFGKLELSEPILSQQEYNEVVNFIRGELEGEAKILDLGCGPGKYAVELNKRVFDVVGLDINEYFIDFANALKKKEGITSKLDFILGDMRKLKFDNVFDCVMNIGNSFGFFDEEQNLLTIGAVYKALKPRGIFILQTGNRDFYLKHFLAKDWRNNNGKITLISRVFSYYTSRMDVTFETEGEKPVTTSSRFYTLTETLNILKQAGLEDFTVFGDWHRGNYSADTNKMIIVSRRRRQGH